MHSDEKRGMLRHFLAALAYRTQKALRDAPDDFADFDAGNNVRTPKELVRHMTSVLGYSRTFFRGGRYRPEPFETLEKEVARFHAMLRRLHGAPVPSENFAFADISPSNVGEEQPAPRRPDAEWREGL